MNIQYNKYDIVRYHTPNKKEKYGVVLSQQNSLYFILDGSTMENENGYLIKQENYPNIPCDIFLKTTNYRVIKMENIESVMCSLYKKDSLKLMANFLVQNQGMTYQEKMKLGFSEIGNEKIVKNNDELTHKNFVCYCPVHTTTTEDQVYDNKYSYLSNDEQKVYKKI